MKLTSEENKRYIESFPRELSYDVNTVLELMSAGKHMPSHDDIGPVSICNELVYIPYRIYSPVPKLPSQISDVQRAIIACIYTRHHDGFVREKSLTGLFDLNFSWVPPFVIQLVGEYVLEIVEQIYKHIEELDSSIYKKFANENENFIALIRARAISYWDCYYRWQNRKFQDFATFRVMNELGIWEGLEAWRILKHQQTL
jgi:hypothetical protein